MPVIGRNLTGVYQVGGENLWRQLTTLSRLAVRVPNDPIRYRRTKGIRAGIVGISSGDSRNLDSGNEDRGAGIRVVSHAPLLLLREFGAAELCTFDSPQMPTWPIVIEFVLISCVMAAFTYWIATGTTH